MWAKSLQLCPTLCNPMDWSLPGSSVHGILQGKHTGVGCHAFPQVIFPTQGSNPRLLCLLHWQAASLPLCVHAKSLQSCSTLCDPMDYSSPGSLPLVPPNSIWEKSWEEGRSLLCRKQEILRKEFELCIRRLNKAHVLRIFYVANLLTWISETYCVHACSVAQSCPTLWDPWDNIRQHESIIHT